MVFVQFFLVYNTYKLKNDRYFLSEAGQINDRYSRSIRNDKVYPGGQSIIDSIIYRHIDELEYLYTNDKNGFNNLKAKLCDTIFTHLRLYSNMDSLFNSIITKNHLSKELQYVLVVSNISVTFKDKNYIPLYQSNIPNPYIDAKSQISQGLIIDGTLSNPNAQNLVTAYNITAPSNYSYSTAFSLYVDTPKRYINILRQMLPVFGLSLFSVILVVLIYFFTYRNWLKQKKLAEMQSDFVNSITHEFNTPLSTIIVANKNMQNEKVYNSFENILPLTKIIERQSNRLKILFSQVLDITKMSKATQDKKEYRLCDLLDEILLDYRLTITDKNVLISLNKNGINPEIVLDRFWFTTMLFNIFDNAIKYNNKPEKSIEVSASADEKNIIINIRDNGIGMPKKTLSHIFEKFYRNKSQETAEVNGLGLGLFYTKQCIRVHGWQIKVESEENVGSTFIIYIPKE
ncbi:sensor histidine kinase [Arachidicoccus ginsenosidimutans]|uniref:sensor histidine kinase n=1 Tax=Arachidicoccus sp. BS20 TaxID=1850526 RepID=UPI001E601641|nr:HAMP domain-containing sensor histidine kinase [Arachidicoccus sp. BS20]